MNLGQNAAVLQFLRPLGLEPGRALANAQPSAEKVRAQRVEQYRYILAHCTESILSATESRPPRAGAAAQH